MRATDLLTTALGVALVAVAAACDGPREGAVVEDPDPHAGTGEMALPPSAAAPRSNAPGHAPDTVRPAEDTLQAGSSGPGVAATVFDPGPIVSDYRRHYREAYVERGAEARGGVDPGLVVAAQRRVARDRGYGGEDPWNALLADMSPERRTVLAHRIAAANERLAAELYGPGETEVP